jgi:multidrug efflux pump subunit AcrA (membrane-fusion protein)
VRQPFRHRLLLAGLLLLAFAAACVGDDRPVVTVEEVRPGEVAQSVTAPARVEPAGRENVAAGVAGTVEGIDAPDGSMVAAGQVVVRLSSPQVDAAQEQAAAAEEAAADAAQGGGGVALPVGAGFGANPLQGVAQQLAAALDASTRPALDAARAKAEKIPKEKERQAALEVVAAAEHAYEQSRAALLSSGQAAAGQQAALASSMNAQLEQLAASAAAPARAQAEVAAANADAQTELLTVEAPFAGTLVLAPGGGGGAAALPGDLGGTDLGGLAGGLPSPSAPSGGGPLRVGTQVVPGQVLFTVFDLSALYANAEVDEVDIPQVTVGQRATVLVDAVADSEFQGIVERIALEATPTEAGGTGYAVRVRLIGPAEGSSDPFPGPLRIGMTGSVEITTLTETSDTVVPSRALLRRGDATVVFVVRDGVASEVPVEVRALGEDTAAVAGDLREGDDVVVAGYEDLADGDPVAVQ